MGLVINISDVLFDSGQYTLRPITREKLARVSGIVLAHPGLRLEAEGHTDSVGTDEFNQQLDEVLNLNLPWLKNNRKGILTAVLQWWKGKKPVPKEQIRREIQRHAGGAGELRPYCQVTVWWLQKKLTRMAH